MPRVESSFVSSRLAVTLCLAGLLAACAGVNPRPAPVVTHPPTAPVAIDACAPPVEASDEAKAVATACAPQAGDTVSAAQREDVVRALAEPFARLASRRHRWTLESRSRLAPDDPPSLTTTDFEPGPRERLRIETPGAMTTLTEIIHVGGTTWQRPQGQDWQLDREGWGAPALQTAAALATVAITGVRQQDIDGQPHLIVDTFDDRAGLTREWRITTDLARGLIVQMDAVDAGDTETRVRYDWNADFPPIEAPVVR